MSYKTTEYTIITDTLGKVLSIENTDKNPTSVTPQIGTSICQSYSIFCTMYPIEKDITLPHISFDNFYGSIIFTTNKNEVLVTFSCEAKQQETQQNLIQTRNQEQLIKNIEKKSIQDLSNEDILACMGFLTLEYKNNEYHLVGNIPEWFKTLHPYYNYSSNIFPLEDIFPFLEIFLPEAEEIFAQNTSLRVISDLWTESTLYDNEMVLQATAIKTKKEYNLLLIESIFERNPDKLNYIRRIRELNTEHRNLQKTEALLRDMLNSREKFISIFSHDIKNPITGVATLINMLTQDNQFIQSFEEQHKQILMIIKKELEHLNEYSERLHEWSKINFSPRDLEITPINIIKMLKQLFISFDSLIAAKKLRCKIDIAPDTQVKGDHVFLKNVLHNLINNAIKFSNKGGTITVSAVEKAKETVISVKDEGIGMNEEIRQSLFDYDRRKTTTGTAGEAGTGIGLSIVRQIIELHNGSVGVESKENKGTTIFLHLPL